MKNSSRMREEIKQKEESHRRKKPRVDKISNIIANMIPERKEQAHERLYNLGVEKLKMSRNASLNKNIN